MRPLISDITLTFTRPSGSQAYDDEGDVVEGAVTTFPATGSLQPFRLGDTQDVLPEGKKAEDFRRFYTRTPLRNADPTAQTSADICVINGEVFEVFDNGDWATTTILTNLSHYKAILVKREEGAT